MELQLGLSLVPANLAFEGFEGNNNCERLTLDKRIGSIANNKNKNHKRSFSQAFSGIGDRNNHQSTKPKTLPLLWSNNPPSDDGDDKTSASSSLVINEVEVEEGVVGWPPMKSWRKRLCCHITGRSDGNHRTVENGCSCGERISKFMYVKVKMEGVGIARKVDLSAHSCFETLMNTLMTMFGNEDSGNYKLTYQDREGDWLLAQDVSWRIFKRSVQRLKLLRRYN